MGEPKNGSSGRLSDKGALQREDRHKGLVMEPIQRGCVWSRNGGNHRRFRRHNICKSGFKSSPPLARTVISDVPVLCAWWGCASHRRNPTVHPRPNPNPNPNRRAQRSSETRGWRPQRRPRRRRRRTWRPSCATWRRRGCGCSTRRRCFPLSAPAPTRLYSPHAQRSCPFAYVLSSTSAPAWIHPWPRLADSLCSFVPTGRRWRRRRALPCPRCARTGATSSRCTRRRPTSRRPVSVFLVVISPNLFPDLVRRGSGIHAEN